MTARSGGSVSSGVRLQRLRGRLSPHTTHPKAEIRTNRTGTTPGHLSCTWRWPPRACKSIRSLHRRPTTSGIPRSNYCSCHRRRCRSRWRRGMELSCRWAVSARAKEATEETQCPRIIVQSAPSSPEALAFETIDRQYLRVAQPAAKEASTPQLPHQRRADQARAPRL